MKQCTSARDHNDYSNFQKLIGNFEYFQEKIDMTEDLGIIVALRGGLDIVSNKASWIFQAINASTGTCNQLSLFSFSKLSPFYAVHQRVGYLISMV